MGGIKAELRRAMRLRRSGLTAAERALAAAVICERLAMHPAFADGVRRGGAVAVYLASPQEIDLRPFIEALLLRGVRVVAPRWNGGTYELARFRGFGEGELRPGPMGILEPAAAEPIPPCEVAVWLVPGLAFTREGARLGYGGGWYDRLLAAAKRKAVKLGIAHAFQLVDALPTEPHDICLDGVVIGG